MMVEIPEIKYIELATQVENPTVWIYSLNDGLRKDDIAAAYCSVLHSKGIMASNVTIYDEKERRNGRLVELGGYKALKSSSKIIFICCHGAKLIKSIFWFAFKYFF